MSYRGVIKLCYQIKKIVKERPFDFTEAGVFGVLEQFVIRNAIMSFPLFT